MTDTPPNPEVPPDPSPASSSRDGDAPPAPAFETPPILPPPAPVVHEVEAVPLSSEEARSPSIDAPAPRPKRTPRRKSSPPANAPSSAPASSSLPDVPPLIPSAGPVCDAPPIIVVSSVETDITQPTSGSPEAATFAPDDAVPGSTEESPPSPPARPTALPFVPPGPPSSEAGSPAAFHRPRSSFWSVVSHLFLFLTIPTFFLGAIATFLVWQVCGKDDAHIEDQAREALNFQINVGILTLLLAASCLGWPLLALTWVLAGIYCLVAASHAGQGENFRYPWIVRIVTH